VRFVLYSQGRTLPLVTHTQRSLFAKGLVDLAHIEAGALLFFPAYAPELNPIERLWRDFKAWLS